MAFRRKLTIYMGKKAKDVTAASGDTVADDTVVVNIDAADMTKAAALEALDEIRMKILDGPWPMA